jgi:hypothetical protein
LPRLALGAGDLVCCHFRGQFLPQADGFHQWNFFCPSSAPVDFAFALQAAMLSPTGVLSASTPSPLVPAWDKTRIP